jgi:hypothetical protein
VRVCESVSESPRDTTGHPDLECAGRKGGAEYIERCMYLQSPEWTARVDSRRSGRVTRLWPSAMPEHTDPRTVDYE